MYVNARLARREGFFFFFLFWLAFYSGGLREGFGLV